MSKRLTSMQIDEDLLMIAKASGLNLTKFVDKALRDHLGVIGTTDLHEFRLRKETEIRSEELKVMKAELKQIQVDKIKVKENRASKTGTDDDILEGEIQWAAGKYELVRDLGRSSEDPEQFVSGRVSTLNSMLSFLLTEAEYRKRVLDVARARVEGQ